MAQLSKAIKDIRGGNRVTDQDPESKYEALSRYARDLTQVSLHTSITDGHLLAVPPAQRLAVFPVELVVGQRRLLAPAGVVSTHQHIQF